MIVRPTTFCLRLLNNVSGLNQIGMGGRIASDSAPSRDRKAALFKIPTGEFYRPSKMPSIMLALLISA